MIRLRRTRAQSGVTLLEMLVVLAVLGLVAGLVVARGPARSPRLELQAASTRLAQAFRLARTRAIARDHPTSVVVDTAQHSFALEGEALVMLPAAVAMSAVTVAGAGAGARAAFIFEPDGSASGGHVDLAAGSRQVQVSIDWLSGRVSVVDAH